MIRRTRFEQRKMVSFPLKSFVFNIIIKEKKLLRTLMAIVLSKKASDTFVMIILYIFDK